MDMKSCIYDNQKVCSGEKSVFLAEKAISSSTANTGRLHPMTSRILFSISYTNLTVNWFQLCSGNWVTGVKRSQAFPLHQCSVSQAINEFLIFHNKLECHIVYFVAVKRGMNCNYCFHCDINHTECDVLLQGLELHEYFIGYFILPSHRYCTCNLMPICHNCILPHYNIAIVCAFVKL